MWELIFDSTNSTEPCPTSKPAQFLVGICCRLNRIVTGVLARFAKLLLLTQSADDFAYCGDAVYSLVEISSTFECLYHAAGGPWNLI